MISYPATTHDLQQSARRLLAGEQFGVLALQAGGQIHTATILFAETANLELIYAIRPATRKARLAELTEWAAFQVDNRGVVAHDRTAFTRAGLEGKIRHIDRGHPDWPGYHDIFAAKHAFGATLLASPEIEMYVLTPSRLRVAAGADPATDGEITPPGAPTDSPLPPN